MIHINPKCPSSDNGSNTVARPGITTYYNMIIHIRKQWNDDNILNRYS